MQISTIYTHSRTVKGNLCLVQSHTAEWPCKDRALGGDPWPHLFHICNKGVTETSHVANSKWHTAIDRQKHLGEWGVVPCRNPLPFPFVVVNPHCDESYDTALGDVYQGLVSEEA